MKLHYFSSDFKSYFITSSNINIINISSTIIKNHRKTELDDECECMLSHNLLHVPSSLFLFFLVKTTMIRINATDDFSLVSATILNLA